MCDTISIYVIYTNCLTSDNLHHNHHHNNIYHKSGLVNLRDVLFVGNPIYDDMPKEQARIEVLKRLPQVAKIDGDMVKPTERELATGVVAA